jgi:hypothetical protein
VTNFIQAVVHPWNFNCGFHFVLFDKARRISSSLFSHVLIQSVLFASQFFKNWNSCYRKTMISKVVFSLWEYVLRRAGGGADWRVRGWGAHSLPGTRASLRIRGQKRRVSRESKKGKNATLFRCRWNLPNQIKQQSWPSSFLYLSLPPLCMACRGFPHIIYLGVGRGGGRS